MCPVRSLEVLGASLACLAIGCDTPNTNIVLGNRYPLVAANALVAYRGFWQNVAFENTSFTTASRTSTALAIMSSTIAAAPRRLPKSGNLDRRRGDRREQAAASNDRLPSLRRLLSYPHVHEQPRDHQDGQRSPRGLATRHPALTVFLYPALALLRRVDS